MPAEVIHIENIKGLSEQEIPALLQKYGKNIFEKDRSGAFFNILWGTLREPMFILLAIACSVYFIIGEVSEGFLMAAAMIFDAAISFFQENKSTKALKALKEFTQPKVTVIRDRKEKVIETKIGRAHV